MALVIRGRSKCRLCGLVISESDVIVTFPSGLFHPEDPAFEVNDAGVHRACLLDTDFADFALRRLGEFLDKNAG
jgi:hypothetical protein